MMGFGSEAVLRGSGLGGRAEVGSAGLLEKRPVAVLPPKREGIAAPSFLGYLESLERKVDAVGLGSSGLEEPSVLLANVWPCWGYF
jgi:hypothetical protein